MAKKFQGVLDALDNDHATYLFGMMGRVKMDRLVFEELLMPVTITITLERIS